MSQELIDAVAITLIKDASFMQFFGLDPSSPADEVTSRIIKGLEPDTAFTSDTVPAVLMYVTPGRFARNHLVFEGKFSVEFYAKSNVEARLIGGRAFKLFHDSYISHKSFNTFRCHLAYDTDFATGITGVKGYKAIYDVDYVRK
ncbi:hypothetical protein BBD42_30880 [Paenibacillus sp. BIHB 4019]|uniref:DUF3168 domain-containing protein n=1 Tax=Paenibacillus sp. BIHB 4019 TaxID=1870819 RepID=A0A1B2DRS3_9BACL|nr:hypothetical protein [Paenibacillus sp. BIHB 4019]ANY70412.1 hypothetical protein BBD42_30880 [Paenibacillus sp. BIHB 4019]